VETSGGFLNWAVWHFVLRMRARHQTSPEEGGGRAFPQEDGVCFMWKLLINGRFTSLLLKNWYQSALFKQLHLRGVNSVETYMILSDVSASVVPLIKVRTFLHPGFL